MHVRGETSMSLYFGQQYIYYDPSGMVYHFYSINKTVYVKIMKNGKVYFTTKIDENILSYSVDIDNSGVFHLVGMTSSGVLRYYIHRNNQWKYSYLTKYDPKSYRFKNLKIFIIDNQIHILMAISNISHSELWVLKHHYFNNQTWFNKKVCDIITEKYDIPFHVDIDHYHHIHIVFKSLYHNQYQIYYCNYHPGYNLWSFPQKISSISQDHSHPFILCDSMNGAHVAWTCFHKDNLQICYLYNPKINSSKNYWSKMKILSNQETNCSHPIIFQVDHEIKVVWKQGGRYFTKNRDLYDNTWNKSQEILFDLPIKFYPISVIGKIYKSWSFVKIPVCYGMVKSDTYLIGLDTMLPHSFYPSIEKQKIAISSPSNLHGIQKTSCPMHHDSPGNDLCLHHTSYESKKPDSASEDSNKIKKGKLADKDLNLNDDMLFMIKHFKKITILLKEVLQDMELKQEKLDQSIHLFNQAHQKNILKIDPWIHPNANSNETLNYTKKNLLTKLKIFLNKLCNF